MRRDIHYWLTNLRKQSLVALRSLDLRIGEIRLLVLTSVVVSAFASSSAAGDIDDIRLYALDCGHLKVNDMSIYSDTGDYDGQPGEMVNPCFLIGGAKGMLLWDTGIGDEIAEHENGVDIDGGFHLDVPVPLTAQLKELGLTAKDITYVAFSHFHLDHTGNANLFDSSTWIVNKTELDWALTKPTPFGVDPSTFSAYKTVKTKMIDNDYDVFGDGTVRILKAPGHTPGMQVLQVKLKRSGTVILSGDLYHIRANRAGRRIPRVNYSRAETLASIDRIETILKRIEARGASARLVIQHEPRDFESLPRLPEYLH